jgi:hypothetical protein
VTGVAIFPKEATMFGMRHIGILLIGGALAALPSVVAAQSGTVPADKLVQRYTALAGTEDNARSLVTGLRDGTDITLSGTTISNPAGMMGYGNVNITLALAEKQLSGVSNPTPTQLNDALTNAGNGILTLRAQGMGWGEIAHTLGFKLGDVMRAEKESPGATRREARAAPQRIAREPGAGNPHNGLERAERAERPEKPQRPERAGR